MSEQTREVENGLVVGVRPFTLLWTERGGPAPLTPENFVFSDHQHGLTSQAFGEPERGETTGGGPVGEAADTTITFV